MGMRGNPFANQSGGGAGSAPPARMDRQALARRMTLTVFGNPHRQSGSNSDPVHMHAAPMPMTVEEACNGGMELLGLLQTCADHMQRGDTALAASTVAEMRQMLGRAGAPSGIPMAAVHFVDALDRRLRHPPNSVPVPDTAMEGRGEIDFYAHTYEAIPHIRFAHLTANEAIWEALDGHDRVHIIDLNLMQDLQWSALIRAFARRPGGPPALRLTGISCPSPDGPGNPSEVGETLTQLARSLGVEFAFRSIVTNNLEEVEGMVDVSPGEAIAVNSVMRLHRLVGDPEAAHQPIDSVLAWIRRLSPAIVTLVEQDAVHNASDFLVRFKEALSYYSCMFNQMVGGGQQQEAETMAAVEAYLRREIYNIVCCEEGARVVRHEPLPRWRWMMRRAGFRLVPMSSDGFILADVLRGFSFAGRGYKVVQPEGCLTLVWQDRPFLSSSSWRPESLMRTDHNPGDKKKMVDFNAYYREEQIIK